MLFAFHFCCAIKYWWVLSGMYHSNSLIKVFLHTNSSLYNWSTTAGWSKHSQWGQSRDLYEQWVGHCVWWLLEHKWCNSGVSTAGILHSRSESGPEFILPLASKGVQLKSYCFVGWGRKRACYPLFAHALNLPEIRHYRTISVQPWRHNVYLLLHCRHIFWPTMEVFQSFLLLHPPTTTYESLVSTGSFQFWHLLGGNTSLYGSLPGKSVWYEVLPFISSKIARIIVNQGSEVLVVV